MPSGRAAAFTIAGQGVVRGRLGAGSGGDRDMRALGDSTPRRLPGTKWTIPSTQPVGMQKDKGLCSSSASQTSYRISHPPLPARDSERGGRVGTRGILSHETEEDRPECSAGGSSVAVESAYGV